MKRTRIRNVSKRPTKSLERAADKLWSEYIRARDKDTCQKCSKPGNNPHHLWTRSIKHLRHDPSNGLCLCSYCHTLGHESAHKGPEAFRDWLISHKGEKWFNALKMRANIPQKPDYNLAILSLKAELEKLKRE